MKQWEQPKSGKQQEKKKKNESRNEKTKNRQTNQLNPLKTNTSAFGWGFTDQLGHEMDSWAPSANTNKQSDAKTKENIFWQNKEFCCNESLSRLVCVRVCMYVALKTMRIRIEPFGMTLVTFADILISCLQPNIRTYILYVHTRTRKERK